MSHRPRVRIAAAFTGCALLFTATSARADAAKVLADLGRAIFFDANLSEPPGTSCASCHDPNRAFAGLNGSTLGVPRGSRPGHYARRTAPSLLYLKYVPKFRFFQEGDDPESEPFGGMFWDGRANTVTDLARQPLLNPDEMNEPDARAVPAKIRKATYGDAFARAFPGALGDPERTLASLGQALDAFLTAPEMSPFSSRFDDFVRGVGTLDPIERKGLRLFSDPAKGGCIGCHVFSATGKDPSESLFTDYGYDAVGVPRNARVPPRRKADLGLCERTDRETPTNQAEYCMQFRTPSLRNVAVRPSFMHNGRFTNLRDVVLFYATRDTDPNRWYPPGKKFDDVPAEYRARINTRTPPYNRHAGDAPALTNDEIDAIVQFLGTLTDAKYAPVNKRP